MYSKVYRLSLRKIKQLDVVLLKDVAKLQVEPLAKGGEIPMGA